MTDLSHEIRIFEAGSDMFVEGDSGDEAYLIRSGFVTAWHNESGERIALGTRTEGEIVGEMALIDDQPRSATVTAQERVEAQVITRAQFTALMNESPQVLTIILRQMIESLRSSNDLVAMYASRPTAEDA